MPDAASRTPAAQDLREVVEAGFPIAVAELSRLVRIPSVSWDGFDQAHVSASAAEVAALARATGVFESVDIVQAPAPAGSGELGRPAVLATRGARNGRPTVLLYAHHDVQPPGDDDAWTSLPFEPTIRGDRLYGRGTGDDKAGVVAHLAALRALSTVHGDDLDLGVVLFVEGEEEWGSPSLPAILEEHRERLASDVIVVADAGNWDEETPALTVALRGLVAFSLRITTLDHAVHSGGFGGPVPDAMLAAIRLLSTLWDSEGAVAVAGLASLDADAPAGPDYDEAKLRALSGLLDETATIGRGGIASRLWYQPSITVTGMDLPPVQSASNTLLASVRARVTVRVAPGQPAREALAAVEAHLREHVPFGARIEIEDVQLGDGFLVDTDGWAAAEALAAMTEATATEGGGSGDGAPAAVQIGAGGSVPFVAELAARFPESQVLVTAVKDPDARAHGVDESLHLPTFRRAILAEAFLLARLLAREPASDGGAT